MVLLLFIDLYTQELHQTTLPWKHLKNTPETNAIQLYDSYMMTLYSLVLWPEIVSLEADFAMWRNWGGYILIRRTLAASILIIQYSCHPSSIIKRLLKNPNLPLIISQVIYHGRDLDPAKSGSPIFLAHGGAPALVQRCGCFIVLYGEHLGGSLGIVVVWKSIYRTVYQLAHSPGWRVSVFW